MPLERCTEGGKAGWRWGKSGKCYTGKLGKAKAMRQGRAIEASKAAEKKAPAKKTTAKKTTTRKKKS